MKNSVKRALALTASVALIGGITAGVGAAPASAAIDNVDLGSVTITPSSFTKDDLPTFTTSAGCPSPNAAGQTINRTIGTITGGDAGKVWTDVIVASTSATNFSTTNPISRAIAGSLESIRTAPSPALPVMGGLYTVKIACVNSLLNESSGYFDSVIYTADGTNFVTVATASTTTSLTAPASATVGSNVTLQASISATAPAGTIQFKNGAANVGTAQAVTAGGSASLTVNNLPLGANSITAVYTPTNAAPPATQYLGSTSTASTVTITAANTTSTLSVTPTGVITSSSSIKLFCTVTSAASAGAITGSAVFQYTVTPSTGPNAGVANPNTTQPVALSGGVASFDVGSAPAGTIGGLRCDFTSSSANYNNSFGTASDITVLGQNPDQVATEFIQTTVEDGALTITVQGFPTPASPGVQNPTGPVGTGKNSPSYSPYVGQSTPLTNIVVLPNAKVNAAGTLIETSGNLIPFQVVDTVAGDKGYAVTGILGEFTGTVAANKINPANLGWTPKFISSSRDAAWTTAAQAGLVDGGADAPANGLQPNVSAASGQPDGLATSTTLYTAPATKGTGTVVYGATVELKAPTTTVADTYQAKLTMTVARLV